MLPRSIMLRGGSRTLLLPRRTQQVVVATYVGQSPEWNRKNRITKVLARVDKPKDYAMEIYRTLKGHYDEVTGMPKIEAAQQSVYDIESALNDANNRKGPINLELQKLREQIHNLNHSLQMCKRHDERYFTIMQELIAANQRDSVEQDRYKLVEEEIRVLFEEYKSAVMRSYAMERTQTTHFKYFSFIFSTVCGGLTFLAVFLKYLTQSAEFKEMQKLMESNELKRKEAATAARQELEAMHVLLVAQTGALDRILHQTQAKKLNNASGSSLYDWLAWACRPLKFW